MTETLTVGGGCFWCLEAVFERLQGVIKVVSGYAGGQRPNPTYEQVCSGATGHAEVIQITFDPAQISARELLELFFAFHDPTTLNAQGPDVGTQYRSVVFAASPAQAAAAREVIAELDGDDAFGAPIVTEVMPLDLFWPAEAYHQQYFQRNPAKAYCAAMIAPKVAKLRRGYAARLKPEQGQGEQRVTETIREKAKKTTFEWIRAIAWAVGIWLLLSTFLVQAYFIPSPSMETTLMVGDVLFVNKFLFGAKIPFINAHLPAIREPRHGDIVVFISPIEDSILVKRLIGLPGDTLEMRAAVLIRNGKVLEEPYTQATQPPGYSLDQDDPNKITRGQMRALQLPHYIGPDAAHYLPDVHDWGPIVVPKDSLWMMGDNRDMSRDARFWGFVPRGNVRGTPIIIYYSWDASSYRPLPFFTATRWGRIFHIPR